MPQRSKIAALKWRIEQRGHGGRSEMAHVASHRQGIFVPFWVHPPDSVTQSARLRAPAARLAAANYGIPCVRADPSLSTCSGGTVSLFPVSNL